MSASRHWIALDEAVTRLLPRPITHHARKRFARRAAALTDIYVARLLNGIANPADTTTVPPQVLQLELTHRALTEALTRAWTTTDDQFGASNKERKVEAD
jgi:hypothetical protein